MGELDGMTALVTGGSRGIGRAVALRLAAEGALVAVHYGGNDAAAAETVALIAKAGGRARTGALTSAWAGRNFGSTRPAGGVAKDAPTRPGPRGKAVSEADRAAGAGVPATARTRPRHAGLWLVLGQLPAPASLSARAGAVGVGAGQGLSLLGRTFDTPRAVLHTVRTPQLF
ncbi:NAD(P)-dependent dehydrogenase (short-subunit alcohol dehydrogenase family) [Kitasatospora sp. MAP5-34]|nr:NAD(P)-dependent dehydrogenase (short-subunit alcohol dehydrogenase family) [Kitasatospora sp. MAP5-34]